MKTLKKNQDEFNAQLFEDNDRFSKLGYLGIFPEDSVKMMLNGQMKLYEDLRENLLVQCAFIAIDSKNGEILAMIGGRSDYLDQYNRSTQALRQPGSVFKPYIYTAAIDNNYPVTTKLLNQPVALYRNNAKGEKEKWTPRNYDNSTGGLTTLREGLRRSLNLISVRMVQELVPPQQVKNMAKRMQITSPIRAVDAIALGTSEVKPIEIVASYATFANRGIYSSPIAITRIEDKYGQTIKEFTNTQKEVLSPETAYIMTNLLQTVMDKGTGGSVRWKYKFTHAAGGKTGTTQNWSDAWFVGFTPSITAGVWFGVDQYPISLGKGQAGSVAALPAWALFMKEAHKTLNIPNEPFDMPEGVVEVEIDSETKRLPTSRTEERELEVFLKSNQPTKEK
jgi:penicillin-binding protein 1A